MKCMTFHELTLSIDMNDLKWRNWNAWIETNELPWMNWNERIDIKELTWMNWNKWIDMNELKSRNRHEWIDMKELNGMNWHEWFEMNEPTWRNWQEVIETHDLKRTNWHEWIETNELTWVNWTEWVDMTDLTWRNWNEWIELNEWNEWIQMNELTWMNWNEWTETNELKWMICRPHLQKMVRTRQLLTTLMWYYVITTWWRCGGYMTSSSRYSLVRILSTSSWPHLEKVVRDRQFLVIFIWNWALATVSCSFCRPHEPKVAKQTYSFFCDFYVKSNSCYTYAHFVDLILTSSWKRGPGPSVFGDFYLKLSSRYSLVLLLSTSWTKSGKTDIFIFLWFLCEIELLLHLCTFCRPHLDLILKTWSGTVSLWWFLSEIELSLQSRARFVGHFPGLRCETAETETLQRRPRTATLPEKSTGFCARECFQAWIHTFPIAHTSQLLDDDVIDMMMWLTWWLRWWCGCPDGETASHW